MGDPLRMDSATFPRTFGRMELGNLLKLAADCSSTSLVPRLNPATWLGWFAFFENAGDEHHDGLMTRRGGAMGVYEWASRPPSALLWISASPGPLKQGGD